MKCNVCRAHLTFEFSLRCERRDGVDHDHRELARLHKLLADAERLLTVVGLTHGEGGRSVPEKLRDAAKDITEAHELLPARRFVVVHTKNDAAPYRLVLHDAETNRQIGRGIGELVNTPAKIKSAAKRILQRAAKVDAN